MSPAVASHYFTSVTPFIDEPVLKSSPEFPVTIAGLTLRFVTGKGVFSKGSLDEGSQILIEYLPPQLGPTFLDLGCGWGPISAFVAARDPGIQVFGVDINPRATQLARFNLINNHLANGHFWCGHGVAACRSGGFTSVACNPPVRAGNEVIGELFAGAHRVLAPGGTLWVVLRTAQGAKSWQKKLAAAFGNCETVAIESGYRILRSQKAVGAALPELTEGFEGA